MENPEHDRVDVSKVDLKVAHMIATYGPDALSLAREHINRYRDQNDWPKEQQWLLIYDHLLLVLMWPSQTH